MRVMQSGKRRFQKGYSVFELITVTAIVAILGATLFPILARAAGNNYTPWCASNLGRLAAAEAMYAQDYNGHYQKYYLSAPGVPALPTWRGVLLPYTRTFAVYNCPARSPRWVNNGNSYNWQLDSFPLSNVRNPSRLVLFSDSDVDEGTGLEDDAIGWADDFHPQHSDMMRMHNRKANIAFADGRVRLINPGSLRESNFNPEL